MELAGFDWDEGNKGKCEKHGVSLLEIEAFLRGSPRVAPDFSHAGHEGRMVAIGRAAGGRPVFVVFTIRLKAGKPYLRPISARYMHGKEIKRYETPGSGDENG